MEASTGKVLHELEGPTEGIEWLAWHPVGDFVVAGSEDFTAWMWNAPLGKCMTVRTGSDAEPASMYVRLLSYSMTASSVCVV